MIRIGGNLDFEYTPFEKLLTIIDDVNYSTILYPYDDTNINVDTLKEFVDQHDLIIGEVGVWNNPLSKNPIIREKAILECKRKLKIADILHANCCINISGSRGEVWDGLHIDNYSQETYDRLVLTIQDIIDSVNPKNTYFALECMPWMTPDSPEQYLKLIKDVNRDRFGVHIDYVNMINSPKRFAFRDTFIKQTFELLNKWIVSVHVKDIKLIDMFPIGLQECEVGTGDINLGDVLEHCSKLENDVVIFVEHLSSIDEYKRSVKYLRDLAESRNINIHTRNGRVK